MDFPQTEAILARLEPWFRTVAQSVGQPTPFEEDDHLYYLYEQRTPAIVQIAKAARMVSGLNAAMSLADDGYAVESAVLLRTVSDFANEIIAIGVDLSTGTLSPSVQRFCDQYFVSPPNNLDDFLNQERDRYVARADLYKSHRSAAVNAGQDADMLLNETRFLDKGYDSYVHGGYRTAMQLYDPNEDQFALEGTYSDHHECVAKLAIAGKAYFAMIALELMAHLHGFNEIADEIRNGRAEFERSPEYDGTICR